MVSAWGTARLSSKRCGALDKLIAAQLRADDAERAEPDPVRRAYERIVAGTVAAER